jgi:pimeloyl-ACP methyl ester carboxylesterase
MFWVRDLLPLDLPNARILTYGFDADVVRAIQRTSSNSIRDHGKSLANDLALDRLRNHASHRPIIFVAHSLGGLVCEQVSSLP